MLSESGLPIWRTSPSRASGQWIDGGTYCVYRATFAGGVCWPGISSALRTTALCAVPSRRLPLCYSTTGVFGRGAWCVGQ